MNKEVWSPVASLFGIYEASSFGRVRRIFKTRPPKKMTIGYGGDYPSVSITINGVNRRRNIHSLVCEAFNGAKPKDKDLVAHFDGNPLNNTPKNLRWATYQENEDDKIRHGTRMIGSRVHSAKLHEKQVETMLLEWESGGKIKQIARANKVSQQCFQSIVYGETWRHVRPDITRKTRTAIDAARKEP